MASMSYGRPSTSVRFALAVGLLLSASSIAPAQEQVVGEPDTIEMEPIEVWYSTEKSQARRAETISVITQEEMRLDDELSPYEFFKHVNGVNLVQGHALGFGLRNPVAGRIQIRGIGRKAGTDTRVRGVLLLMDGVPDFSVTHGHPLPDMFSRSYVDEIEVIKGPSSVRYGWAQAGVILMRSKDPQKLGNSGYLALSGGAFSTTQDLLDYDYRWDDGFVQLSGALRRSDGHRSNSETEALDGRIRLAQALSPNVTVVGSFRGGTNDWEIPGPVGGNPGVGGENDWWIADGGLRYETGAWDVTGKVWGFDGEVEFEDDLTEPNEAWGSRFKAETAAWTGGQLLLGFDLLNYRLGRGREDVDRTDWQTEGAPYVWVSHDTGRWILTGGARFTANEQFGEDFSPEAGVVYLASPRTSLRAHVSHGFRAPNPFEFAFGGEEDLDATDLWQYELGWNQQVGGFFTFDVVGWVQDGSNMIKTVFDPTVQDERLTNTGAFTHAGVEAEIAYADPRGWRFGVAGTTMELEDDTALVPAETVDVWVGYEPGKWGVRFEGRWAGDRFQNDDEELRLDNYFVADAKGWYRLPNGVGVRLEIENVTDEDYELFRNWPMPGIAAYVGLDYRY